MDKKLIFLLESFFLLLFFAIIGNLLSKYYVGRSAIDVVIPKIKFALAQTPEELLQHQMERDYELYSTHLIVPEFESKRPASSVPALVYHGIDKLNSSKSIEPEDVSQNLFYRQMAALKKDGYNTITIDQFNAFMSGKIQLPEKSFLLTFDDAKKTSYYNGDPILRALGFNAVMFAISIHSTHDHKSSYYLTKEELMKMQLSGRWSIQSHGKLDHNPIQIDNEGNQGRFITHKMWLQDKNRAETDIEYEERLKKDMDDSKADLEKTFNTKIANFAFPFGDYGDENSANRILRVVGSVYPYSYIQFRSDARTGYTRSNFTYQTDTTLIRRIKVTEGFEAEKLVKSLNASMEKELPYKEEFEEDNEHWTGSNGRRDFVINGTMTLGSVREATNAAVFLDGSFPWKNYKMTTTAKLKSGASFGLIARAIDGKNMFVCTFKPDSVIVDQRVGGLRVQLNDTNNLYSFNVNQYMNVGIAVVDDVVYCLHNDKVITRTYRIVQPIQNGGVGISVNAGQTTGTLEVKNVKVEKIENEFN